LTTVCPGFTPSLLPASIVTVSSKPKAEPSAVTCAGTTVKVPASLSASNRSSSAARRLSASPAYEIAAQTGVLLAQAPYLALVGAAVEQAADTAGRSAHGALGWPEQGIRTLAYGTERLRANVQHGQREGVSSSRTSSSRGPRTD
jgi:hypothetical protein